jgi:hypothetical protein
VKDIGRCPRCLSCSNFPHRLKKKIAKEIFIRVDVSGSTEVGLPLYFPLKFDIYLNLPLITSCSSVFIKAGAVSE